MWHAYSQSFVIGDLLGLAVVGYESCLRIAVGHASSFESWGAASADECSVVLNFRCPLSAALLAFNSAILANHQWLSGRTI